MVFTFAACGEDGNNQSAVQPTEQPENPNVEENTEQPESPSVEENTEQPENPNPEENPEQPENPNAEENIEQPENPEPTTIKTELTVWNMTCGRCENKIKNALLEIDGVIDVFADSSADKVTIEHEPDLDLTIIEKAITGEGFNLP